MQWQAFCQKESKDHTPLTKSMAVETNLNNTPRALKPINTSDPPTTTPTLEVFKKMVIHDMEAKFFNNRQRQQKRSNLTKSETLALKELSNNTDIIIKKADKGGSIVIQDKSAYIAEAHRQLTAPHTYLPLSKDPTNDLKRIIDTVLQEAVEEGTISSSTAQTLITRNPRVPVLYLLPKIHKDTKNPPGRPIVSGYGSVLQTLAIYITQFLKPHVQALPHCLKDTNEFLHLLKSTDFTGVSYLGSFDVVNLYTSIPHDEALNCARQELGKSPHLSNRDINFLLTLLELVLTKNYFKFNDQFYQQLLGCSMGSSVAPDLANIFMSHLETEKILNIPQFKRNLKCYCRYVDDIFIAWTGSLQELHEMLAYINTIHPTIKFTLEADVNQQRFLDVLVTKSGNTVNTSLFKKSTDCNTALLRNSFHPPNVFKSVLTGHLTRLRRNTSSDSEFTTKCAEIINDYHLRGYSKKETDECIKNTLKPRGSPSTKNQPNTILLCQYGTHIPLLRRTIKKHWTAIQSDPSLKRIFPDPPRLIFRKGRSISNIVTKSDISATPSNGANKQLTFAPQKRGTFPCLNCCNCSAIIKGENIHHPSQGHKIKVKNYYTCTSKNVIYLIKCPCGLAYVGQTSRMVKTRISEHKSTIRSFQKDPTKFEEKKETSLARHFHTHKHVVSDLKWQIIDQVKPKPNTDTKQLLLQTEVKWIHKLKTLHPGGLNEECNYNLAWH